MSPIEKRMMGRSELWGIRRHLTDEGGGSRLVTPVCPNIEVRYIYTIAEQCELERVGGWREGDTLVQKVGGGDPALHFITLHYSVIITLHFIALHHSVIITLHFITFVHCNTMPLYWSTSHYIGAKRWEEAIPHYGNMRPTRQEHGGRVYYRNMRNATNMMRMI